MRPPIPLRPRTDAVVCAPGGVDYYYRRGSGGPDTSGIRAPGGRPRISDSVDRVGGTKVQLFDYVGREGCCPDSTYEGDNCNGEECRDGGWIGNMECDPFDCNNWMVGCPPENPNYSGPPPVPTLSCNDATAGGTVTCQIQSDAAPISGAGLWRFEGDDQTITKNGGSTWSGPAIIGGSVDVKVAWAGDSVPLHDDFSVTRLWRRRVVCLQR